MRDLSWNADEEEHFQKLLQLAYNRDIKKVILEIKKLVSNLDTEANLLDFYDQIQFIRLELDKKHRKSQPRLMQLGKFLAEELIFTDEILSFSSSKQKIILQNASLWQEEE